MKIPLQILLIIGFILASLSISCSKQDDLVDLQSSSENALDGPFIDIHSPLPGEDFQPGDTVWITGTIAHIFTLHEYLIQLENLETGELICQEVEHVHFGSNVNFSHPWVNNLQQNASIRIILRANDHGDLIGSKEITIYNKLP